MDAGPLPLALGPTRLPGRHDGRRRRLRRDDGGARRSATGCTRNLAWNGRAGLRGGRRPRRRRSRSTPTSASGRSSGCRCCSRTGGTWPIAASPELAVVWFRPGGDTGEHEAGPAPRRARGGAALRLRGRSGALGRDSRPGSGSSTRACPRPGVWSVGVVWAAGSIWGTLTNLLRQVLPVTPRPASSRQRPDRTARAARRGRHRPHAAADGARDRRAASPGRRRTGRSTWSASAPAAPSWPSGSARSSSRTGSPSRASGAVDITLYRDDVFRGPAQARDRPHRAARADRGADRRAGRRRALHRADHPRRDGRAGRLRPAAGGQAGGAGRSRAGASCRSSPTIVGLTVQTTAAESVRVMLSERGEPDRVVLRERRA